MKASWTAMVMTLCLGGVIATNAFLFSASAAQPTDQPTIYSCGGTR